MKQKVILFAFLVVILTRTEALLSLKIEVNLNISLRSRMGCCPSNTDVRLVDYFKTPLGSLVRQYQVTYGNLTVKGAKIRTVSNSGDPNRIDSTSGEVPKNLDRDLRFAPVCYRSDENVIRTILRAEGLPRHCPTSSAFITDVIYLDKNQKAYRAKDAVLQVTKDGKETKLFYVIDTCSGTVLSGYNYSLSQLLPSSRTRRRRSSVPRLLPSKSERQKRQERCPIEAVGVGGNVKTGKIRYGEPPLCLDVRKDGDTCYMENQYVKIIDLKTTEDMSKREVISFKCSEGYQDEVNGGYSPATDTLYYGTQTFRMYENWYKFRPANFLPLIVFVHYGRRLENAFYSSGSPNIAAIGDGDTDFYPLSTADVLAHEMSHGITDITSGLEYRDQSGGINEAISDMASQTLEFFLDDKTDFQVGVEVTKSSGGNLRSMSNPSSDGRSINSADKYKPYMDVHYTSGVFNRAFFVLVQELGMPVREAFETGLAANRFYWGATETFTTAACGMKKAAYSNGLDCDLVAKAFESVGVPSCSIEGDIIYLEVNVLKENLTVSSIRQPTFGFKPTPQMTIKATATSADNPIRIIISTDMSRASTILGEGSNLMTYTSDSDSTFYIRLASDTQKDIFPVSLIVTIA